MPTEKEQIELFRQGCEALGGNRAAARALNNIAERTIRALLAGDRKLHKGFLKDMANALYQHSRKCRDIERQLDPMFWENLTAEQQAPLNAAVAKAKVTELGKPNG